MTYCGVVYMCTSWEESDSVVKGSETLEVQMLRWSRSMLFVYYSMSWSGGNFPELCLEVVALYSSSPQLSFVWE